MSSSILVVIALPDEAQNVFAEAQIPVLFTGLGKINATYHLTRALCQDPRPSLVVNFGTAGSFYHPTHALVECTRFVQRDMDVSALGFALGVTPFDKGHSWIEVKKYFPDLPDGICGTGDRFETTVPQVPCDVVDMEAFALAKVCQNEGLPFLSIKYITDGSDEKAHEDWQSNLPHAAAAFLTQYQRLVALGL